MPMIPCKIQIGSPIQVQFILEHLMDRIGRCSLLWDLELGDFLLAGITRRVRGKVRGCASGVQMMVMGFGRVVVESLNEGIRVNLT